MAIDRSGLQAVSSVRKKQEYSYAYDIVQEIKTFSDSKKSLLGVIFCAPAYFLVDTNLYLGGLRLHSNFSLDVYEVRNLKMTPDMAYRFALGIPNSCNRNT